MKSKLLLVSIIIATALFSYNCTSSKKAIKTNVDVSSFVGTWVGENRLDDSYTTWIQQRFEDGTYTVFIIKIEGNAVSRSIESGKWWLENGKFLEISPELMKKPDEYTYTIISRDQILFKSTSVDYQFIDKKIKGNFFDRNLMN